MYKLMIMQKKRTRSPNLLGEIAIIPQDGTTRDGLIAPIALLTSEPSHVCWGWPTIKMHGVVPLIHRRLVEQRTKRVPLPAAPLFNTHCDDLHHRYLLLRARSVLHKHSGNRPSPDDRSPQQPTFLGTVGWPVPHFPTRSEENMRQRKARQTWTERHG